MTQDNKDLQHLVSQLLKGQVIDADIATARTVLGEAMHRCISFTSPVARHATRTFSAFNRLAINAGLITNDPAYLAWTALRCLNMQPGDRLNLLDPCPVTEGLMRGLGIIHDPHARISLGLQGQPATISIGGTGPALVTPIGRIAIQGLTADIHAQTWAKTLQATQTIPSILGQPNYTEDPNTPVTLDWDPAPPRTSIDADSIHDPWQPEIATHPRLKPHPAQLVQSATMAAVRPPMASYKPTLTNHVLDRGLISDAQFDALVAIGEAHKRFLPNDERVGFVLADGTGTGKTNTCLGAILDNRLKGRRRSIVVLEKRRHAQALIDTWKSFGQVTSTIVAQWDTPDGDFLPDHDGIMLTTYSLLRTSSDQSEYSRLNQLTTWAGPDFDGILIFDEAQNMRNATADESRTDAVTSRQGEASLLLQEMLPKARVIYASATAFSDPHNLGYCTRLGLWGQGTCFPTRRQFLENFETSSIGALEQVMLSVKTNGCTVGRNLSLEGVTQDILAYNLDQNERDIFNRLAKAWNEVWKAQKEIFRACNIPQNMDAQSKWKTPYNRLIGIHETNRRASISTLIASLKTKAVIEDIRKQLASGHCAVVQLHNTCEAHLDRALAQQVDPSEIRVEATDLLAFIDHLPETMHTVRTETRRNTVWHVCEPVMENGQPVVSPEAVAIKARLRAQVRQIRLPLPPLDQIIMTFGTSRVAEITGRTKRIVPDHMLGADGGQVRVHLEKRTEENRMRDLEDFQSGRKRILVFSAGAGGSSLSYHAIRGSANERKRIHYLVQLGHRADLVIQGVGRTHRANQATPPSYVVVTTDLPADQLYASRIIEAMFRLGALSNGHRHAATQGLFDERDNLNGPYAAQAWRSLIHDLEANKLRGALAQYTRAKLADDLGMRPSLINDLNDQIINRIAGMTDRRQYLLFEEVRKRIDQQIEIAIAEGNFHGGPTTAQEGSFRLITEHATRPDPIHGSSCRILRIQKKSVAIKTGYIEAYRQYRLQAISSRRRTWFARHRSSGMIALIIQDHGRPNSVFGTASGQTEIITPTHRYTRWTSTFMREPWTPVTRQDVVQKYWDAQIAAAPDTITSYTTLVTGALLNHWHDIMRCSSRHTSMLRIGLPSGPVIGIPLPPGHVPGFMAAIGMDFTPSDTELDAAIEHLKNNENLLVASGTPGINHQIHPELDAQGKLAGISITLARATKLSLARVLENISDGSIRCQAGTTFPLAQGEQEIRRHLGLVLSHAVLVSSEFRAVLPDTTEVPATQAQP